MRGQVAAGGSGRELGSEKKGAGRHDRMRLCAWLREEGRRLSGASWRTCVVAMKASSSSNRERIENVWSSGQRPGKSTVAVESIRAFAA